MSVKKNNTTMSSDKMWFTTRLRLSTKNKLDDLAGTRQNGIGTESYDDVVRRLLVISQLWHKDTVDKIFPLSGEQPSNEDYLNYFQATTEEMRMADALEARKRKEEFYTNMNKEISDQNNTNKKDFDALLKSEEGHVEKNVDKSPDAFETLFDVKPKVKV